MTKRRQQSTKVKAKKDRSKVSQICFSSLYTCPGCCLVAKSGPTLLQPARLLCPWDSPGKNTGAGCHALLQGVLPTQRSNLSLQCLLRWQADSLPLSHLGSPRLPTAEIEQTFLSTDLASVLAFERLRAAGSHFWFQ